MTLLEVILALAVFMIAGAALFQAAMQANMAAFEAREEQGTGRRLESQLQEILNSTAVSELNNREWQDENSNINYRLIVEPAQMSNQEGEELTNLYRVELEALSPYSSDKEPLSLERLIYAPLYNTEQNAQ